MAQEYQHLLIDTTSSGVRTITLNRPERLNAVNTALANEIPKAIQEASVSDEVRVIVLTGAGRGFCAGLDLDPANIKETMSSRNQSRAARLDNLGWVGQQALAITNSDKPVIAAINGAAAGAGLALALAADIRLIKASTVITTGYVRRGLSPDAGLSYFLPRLIGTSRATELIMTSRDISAEEAERIGLVSYVYAENSFEQEVTAYAERLAAGPPLALTYTKRLLTASPDTDLTTQLKSELAFIHQCFNSEDVREAMAAFMQKRSPNFKGQ